MPTKKSSASKATRSTKSKPTKRRPVKHTGRRSVIPILPEVAPELKEHIVGPAVSKINTDGYWPTLAWLGIGLLGILVVSGSTTWLAASKMQRTKLMERPITIAQPAQPVLSAVAPLTGLPAAEETVSRRPWAVVVENFFTVRPQAGLSAADIVFESPTEGGITRLLAIYQSRLPVLVGPIRSARSYFNDWIRPLAPFYSHSGGSDRALQQLKKGYGGIIDINEFFHGAAYSRESRYKPPHNLFTTPERFFSYLQNNKYNFVSNLPMMSFTTSLPTAPQVTQVAIPYVPEEYSVTYEYQPGSNTYQRLVDGTTQLDASTNQVLTVKNVIVLFTDITPIPNDPLLRVELRTIGQGQVRSYTGGQVYEGTWRKPTPDSVLEFIDSTGRPLPMQPGNTWISVIDSSQADIITTATAEPQLY